MRYIWRRAVRFFVAGLLAVLPLVITIAIVVWVAEFLEGFIGPSTPFGETLHQLGLGISPTRTHTAAYVLGWIVVLVAVFALGVVVDLGARTESSEESKGC